MAKSPRKTAHAKLEAPAGLSAEEKREWNRIIAAVKEQKRTLKPADRSLLALYVRTWTINQDSANELKKNGSVIAWPNGLEGPSPHYKTFVETVRLLQQMLAALGCTPASRRFDQADNEDFGPLEF